MSLITVIYYYVLSSGSNTLWDHTLYTKKKNETETQQRYIRDIRIGCHLT